MLRLVCAAAAISAARGATFASEVEDASASAAPRWISDFVDDDANASAAQRWLSEVINEDTFAPSNEPTYEPTALPSPEPSSSKEPTSEPSRTHAPSYRPYEFEQNTDLALCVLRDKTVCFGNYRYVFAGSGSGAPAFPPRAACTPAGTSTR